MQRISLILLVVALITGAIVSSSYAGGEFSTARVETEHAVINAYEK